MRVIDFECNLPGHGTGVPAGHEPPPLAPDRLPPRAGYGYANYSGIFPGREAPKEAPSLAEFVAMLDRAGVETGVLAGSRSTNAAVAEAMRAFPGRFVGFAYVSPLDGMPASRELERLVREEGFAGLAVSALRDRLPPSDRRYYPLYAKCVDLGIPVRAYTAMSYANDLPYDVAHPRHLDRVAIDFPELRLVAGLGGWPWVNEMVGLLRRHPNLYCDTAAHRPRYFAVPGSGWDMFMQYGNTLLRRKIMVGLSQGLLSDSFEELIEEYLALPLKDEVKELWLHGNAARFLGLA